MSVAFVLLLLTVQRVEFTPSPAGPLLIVTGTGQVMASPDQAVVRLGIQRQATVAQTAQEQANAVAQEILNAIGKVGVAPQQIQTSRLVLSPVYAPRAPESRDAPRIVSYNATNSVSVRLDNLSLVGPVIDAGLKAGANQLDGVQFQLRNDLPQRELALRQAVNEAQQKARAMAEALRVNLGEVLEVTEGNGQEGRPVLARAASASSAAFGSATPVAAGEIEVDAQVTIRYRISPKP